MNHILSRDQAMIKALRSRPHWSTIGLFHSEITLLEVQDSLEKSSKIEDFEEASLVSRSALEPMTLLRAPALLLWFVRAGIPFGIPSAHASENLKLKVGAFFACFVFVYIVGIYIFCDAWDSFLLRQASSVVWYFFLFFISFLSFTLPHTQKKTTRSTRTDYYFFRSLPLSQAET